MLGILYGKTVKVACIDVKSSHLLRACFDNMVMAVSNCKRRQNKQNQVHCSRQSQVIIIEDLVKKAIIRASSSKKTQTAINLRMAD